MGIANVNLKLIADQREWGPGDLVRLMGRTPSFWSDRLNDRNNIGAKLARDIEVAFGLPRYWMDEDHSSERVAQHPQSAAPPEPSNVEPGPQRVGRVPLISSVQAGEMTDATDIYAPGYADEWVPTTAPVHAHTYALRVKGDSMEPMIPEGYVVIVEPEADPREGDVVVTRNGDLEANIKLLVRVSGDWYLKPANKDYKPKPLGDAKIVGVVVASQKMFR